MRNDLMGIVNILKRDLTKQRITMMMSLTSPSMLGTGQLFCFWQKTCQKPIVVQSFENFADCKSFDTKFRAACQDAMVFELTNTICIVMIMAFWDWESSENWTYISCSSNLWGSDHSSSCLPSSVGGNKRSICGVWRFLENFLGVVTVVVILSTGKEWWHACLSWLLWQRRPLFWFLSRPTGGSLSSNRC